MIGWPDAWKCRVAWRFGELSQQPTWPHVRQSRRCTQIESILRHSSQPNALGTTLRIPAEWVHSSAIGPPDVAHDGRFAADVGEKPVQRRDHLCPLADGGGNALHRPGTHVTDREDA